MFCIEYYVGTYNYLNQELSKLPVVKIGVHGNKRALRIYRGPNKYKEVLETSPLWPQYYSTAQTRRRLKRQLTELIKSCRSALNVDCRKLLSDYQAVDISNKRFNTEFWNSITPETPTYTKDNNYDQSGIQFRSRVEVIIARILDELGLEYRYDVMIRANGHKYFVDFVVYLPQFDSCFFIEYFGSLNEQKYLEDSLDKTKNYYKDRLYPGEQLLLLCGDKDTMPSYAVIREQIAAMVNGIAKQHIIKGKNNENLVCHSKQTHI